MPPGAGPAAGPDLEAGGLSGEPWRRSPPATPDAGDWRRDALDHGSAGERPGTADTATGRESRATPQRGALRWAAWPKARWATCAPSVRMPTRPPPLTWGLMVISIARGAASSRRWSSGRPRPARPTAPTCPGMRGGQRPGLDLRWSDANPRCARRLAGLDPRCPGGGGFAPRKAGLHPAGHRSSMVVGGALSWRHPATPSPPPTKSISRSAGRCRSTCTGADVIHSFWVPALAGKTDTIPGRTNMTWLQADRPGVYRGQCTEYLRRRSTPIWPSSWSRSPRPTSTPGAQSQAKPRRRRTANARAGQLFVDHCGACHTMRGTAAGGILGPDLTHLMSRTHHRRGTLPNNAGDLTGWIANPQALKPGAKMPADLPLRPRARQLAAYPETLK